jgi:hypothetical protein
MTYLRGTILYVPQLHESQHAILYLPFVRFSNKYFYLEHLRSFSVSHARSLTSPQKNAVNAINEHNGPRHDQTIRNLLANALPPRHNRQLHLERINRPRNNRLPNLGPAERHLTMANLLPQLRLHNPTHLRAKPRKRRRLPLQHLRLPRPRIARQGISPAR